MRLTYFLLLAYLVLGSSCTRYQFYSFTTDKLNPVAGKGFVQENTQDSVQIVYKWYPSNRAGIEIYNTSNQIVQIDWTRSALIVNDVKQDIFNNTSETEGSGNFQYVTQTLNGSPSGSDLSFGGGNFNINATTSVTQSQNIVIPRSKSEYILPILSLPYRDKNFQKKDFVLVKFKQTGYADATKLYVRKFEKANSPMRVRFFLTYKTGNGTNRTIDEEFWVHECIETDNPNMPAILMQDKNAPPIDKYNFNKIVSIKHSGYGAGSALFWGGLLAGVIIVAGTSEK